MEPFELFVKKVDAFGVHFEEIQTYNKKYGLRRYFIEQITPQQALNLQLKIHEKFYEGKKLSGLLVWYQNQLRVFVWVLVCYTLMNLSELEDLKQSDFRNLEKLFPQKDSRLLDYQHRSLILESKSHIRYNPWSEEETLLLKSIKHSNRGKWNQVSKELYFQSNGKYFRIPKQCRERWLNHDNPKKKSGFWNAEECLLMLQLVKQYGKKWAFLSKKFQGSRNQHSIKNKFNSLQRKYKKKHPQCEEEHALDGMIIKVKNLVSHKRQNFKSLKQLEKEQEILYSNSELKKKRNNRSLQPQKTYLQKIVDSLMKLGNKKQETPKNVHQLTIMKPNSFEKEIIQEEQANKIEVIQKNILIFQESISEEMQIDFFE